VKTKHEAWTESDLSGSLGEAASQLFRPDLEGAGGRGVIGHKKRKRVRNSTGTQEKRKEAASEKESSAGQNIKKMITTRLGEKALHISAGWGRGGSHYDP